MYTFPQLIKKIREEAGLTQAEFAKVLDVSAVLISMVEVGQKEVSKNLLLKLAEKMDVSPNSITPFLFAGEDSGRDVSKLEKKLILWGEKMQEHLIVKKSKLLNKYANRQVS
jgi:transcriptional regulator with XRE-family HTH domain